MCHGKPKLVIYSDPNLSAMNQLREERVPGCSTYSLVVAYPLRWALRTFCALQATTNEFSTTSKSVQSSIRLWKK